MKKILLPLLVFITVIVFWELYVTLKGVSKFVLPAPTLVIDALVKDFPSLFEAALNTLKVTLIALFCAALSGILMAFLFSVSKNFERAVYPFAVILQVTPIVAIAPLVIIWVGLENIMTAQVIIAWLVAFFPIMANMSAGLSSVDRNLVDLFKLYSATPIQKFRLLLWPTALPYLLASLKVSAGLALVGGVVAEFVAGSGTASGLAWRIIEAGNRLQVEKMFAGLLLLMVMGVILFYSFALLERVLLKYRYS